MVTTAVAEIRGIRWNMSPPHTHYIEDRNYPVSRLAALLSKGALGIGRERAGRTR